MLKGHSRFVFIILESTLRINIAYPYLKFMEFPFEKIFLVKKYFLFDKLGHPVILLSHFVV